MWNCRQIAHIHDICITPFPTSLLLLYRVFSRARMHRAHLACRQLFRSHLHAMQFIALSYIVQFIYRIADLSLWGSLSLSSLLLMHRYAFWDLSLLLSLLLRLLLFSVWSWHCNVVTWHVPWSNYTLNPISISQDKRRVSDRDSIREDERIIA